MKDVSLNYDQINLLSRSISITVILWILSLSVLAGLQSYYNIYYLIVILIHLFCSPRRSGARERERESEREMSAAGVSLDSWRRRARSKVWLLVYRMLADFNQAASDSGGGGDSRDGAGAPRGFDTYNNRREARGACTLAGQPVCLDQRLFGPLVPSVRFAVTWRLLSLLSRANTSPNRRFYGPPSTFNEGTLRGGFLSESVLCFLGLVDNFRVTTILPFLFSTLASLCIFFFPPPP